MRGARRLPGLLAAVAVLALARPASGEVTLVLQLDRSEATLAESLVLSVSVSGAHGNDARPAVQGLEDFVVRPAGTSTRVEIVNGQYSAGTEFSFLLQPKKAGTFTIGPAELKRGGATYRSNVAAVTIGQPAASPGGERGPVFLVASVTPAKVYVEQQALYTLKLFRSVNVADVSVTVPEVGGIAFAKSGEPREYQSTHAGRAYQVVEVRYLVTPQKAGNYTLPPTRMELTAFAPRARGRRGVFDDPFFGQMASGRPLALATEALALHVQPLPLEGRPADYGGLVGSFTLEASVEPRELAAGDSATLTAIVRGRGNVKRLPEIRLPPIDGVKVYADRPVLKDETTAEGVSGSKTMKWALVPERAGRYRLPSLTMSYFDTAAGRYRTLKSGESTLTVAAGGGDQPRTARGAGAAAPAPTHAPARREVAELGNDILPVHAVPGPAAAGFPALPGAAVFWLLLVGPPAGFLLVWGGIAVRRRTGTIAAALTVRNAAAGLAKACKRGGLSAEDLLQALQEYLSRRLSLARGSRTADEAAELLRSRGVDAGAVGELHGLWRRIEDAVYTGKGRETTDAGEAVVALVARIEKDLR